MFLLFHASVQGAFFQANGLVVMEAENFEASTTASAHSWVATNGVAGFVGAAAMRSMPNSGLTISTNLTTTSPMLSYSVQLTNSGAAKLWIRGWAASGSDDSIYVGVDNVPTPALSYGVTGAWFWKSANITLTNSGLHQVNLWMREDGAYVDRLILSLNAAFTPTNEGPAETVLSVQLSSPASESSFMTGTLIPVTATVVNAGSAPVGVSFYVNGSLTVTDTNSPFAFDWLPTAGGYSLTAVASNSLGNIVTSAPVSITVTSLPAATFRYSASSARIYVEGGGVATLSDIKAALPNAPLFLVDPTNQVWFLAAHIFVSQGSTLRLHGSAVGGDVNELRLKSNNSSASNSFVSLDADYGTIDLNGVTVTSWDEAAGSPDTEYATYQRAFLRARSRLVGSAPQQSTLHVVNSEVAYLGYKFSECYGLTWQVVSSVAGVKVFGNVTGSDIHDCQLGVGTWAADDVSWTGNEIAFNTLYGYLASDATHQAVLASNNVHDNDYGAVLRWASSSQRIYVTGPGTATLSDIKAAVPSAPLTLVDPVNLIWYLGANLFVENGAKLNLYGPAIGGDVAELRLKSDNTSAANAYIEVRADWGWLDIRDTKVISWDNAVSGPDLETDTFRRSYIRARSTLDPDGVTAHESRMDVVNSEIAYLGSHNTEAYGVSWKVVDTTAAYLPPGSTNTLFDLVNVYGDILNSHLHHNYFGMYSYGHHGGIWATNEVNDNIAYGFDPHDDSDYLVIEGNNVHHNGWHGIIASKRCDSGVMRNNVTWNNGLDLANPHGHGIMLHRSCHDWVVEGNLSYGNADSGIAIFDSDRVLIRDNVCLGNTNAGIRLSVGAADNWVEGNEVGGTHQYGLYLFEGNDVPEPDDDGSAGSGRCRGNTFTNNFVYNYTSDAIKLKNCDSNLFIANVFLGSSTTWRFDGGTNNRLIGNSTPPNTLAKLLGTVTNLTSTIFKRQSLLSVQLDTNSTAIMADDDGAIFDCSPADIMTVVDGDGSFATATAAQLGTETSPLVTRKLFVTPDSGGVLVKPEEWSLSGNQQRSWTAQASSSSAQITYLIGDLTPARTYTVRQGLLLLANHQANDEGYITFTTIPATTTALDYSVRRQ
jgi:poly(beta-D-mannuronate) C5 epimerase